MTKSHVLCAVVAFALGATTALIAKPKIVFDSKAFYAGKERQAASATLLAEGERLAGDDTWQRIGVGRVAYLSGDKKRGEAIFASVMSGKFGKSDLYRIATTYAAAAEWSKAKPVFEKAIAMDPDDDSGMIKVGCWFNINGERERAEQLFDKAFAKSPDSEWHYILAAGSYVGVEPF